MITKKQKQNRNLLDLKIELNHFSKFFWFISKIEKWTKYSIKNKTKQKRKKIGVKSEKNLK